MRPEGPALSDKEFIAYLRELLDPLGAVTARAMFGGWGVYLGGIIIGIVVEGRLYLKTDAINQPHFVEAGSAAFVYMSKDGPMAMSYWSVPDEALDAADAMAPWAKLALEAARRKPLAKPRRKADATGAAKNPKPLRLGNARKAVLVANPGQAQKKAKAKTSTAGRSTPDAHKTVKSIT